jgi:hypothetical protein
MIFVGSSESVREERSLQGRSLAPFVGGFERDSPVWLRE